MVLALGLESCPCVKVACKRHGICSECMANHSQKPENPFPWCIRPENVDKVLEILGAEMKKA